MKNATSEYQYIPDTETQQCNEYEVVEEAMYKCMGQMPCNTEEYITDEYKAGFFSPIKRITLGNTVVPGFRVRYSLDLEHYVPGTKSGSML